jgi:CheY-like chemotaxis protein
MTKSTISVLVVDDAKVNRKLISHVLRTNGCDVCSAETGEIALELCNEKQFDVILMDVNLPGISGVEASKKIRNSSTCQSKNATIIGISAHASQQDRQSYLDAGMNSCLPKPIDLQQLVCAVRPNHAATNSNSHMRPVTNPIVPDSATACTEDSAQVQILDIDAALMRIGSNHDLYQRFVVIFQDETTKLLKTGKTAIDETDLRALSKIAHRIRGMSANLAADELNVIATSLEAACEDEKFDQSCKLFCQMTAAYQRLQNEFQTRGLVPDVS